VVRKLMLMGLLNSADVERVEQEFEVMDADGSGEITMEDLDIYLAEQEKLQEEKRSVRLRSVHERRSVGRR
jgi:Ca2+-binding EF-hand superfamily protein